MTVQTELQRHLLETAVAELRAEGFDVILQPSKRLLPSFLQDFAPDAVAFGKEKNLVLEIVSEGGASQSRLDALRERLSGQEKWTFKVYAITGSTTKEIDKMPIRSIEDSTKSMERLIDEDQLRAALLIGWATFEALGRAILPDQFRRPQTPGRLVEVLAGRGQITPSAAEQLRKLATARNQVIHGGLDTEPRRADLDTFLAIVRSLTKLLSAETA